MHYEITMMDFALSAAADLHADAVTAEQKELLRGEWLALLNSLTHFLPSNTPEEQDEIDATRAYIATL